MLSPRRALLLLGLTSLAFGCSSTIIVGSPPEVDSGVAPVDVPGAGDDIGIVEPVDAFVPSDTPAVPRDTGTLRRCNGTAQCGRGEVCLGVPGCGTPWVCTPNPGRTCTGDVAPFCGCDGQTFRASSSCPDRPFLHVGPCERPTPLDGGGPLPTGCVLADGRACGLGETCRVDECTICRCTARGLECASTGMCRDAGGGRPDAVVRPDASAGSCTVRGVTCPVGATCRISPEIVCFCAAPERPECRVIGTDAGVVPTDGGGTVVDASFRDAVPTDGVPLPDAGNVCASQDARGEGFCDLFLGVYWMSNRCVGVSGCRCVGSDCGRQYMSFVACEEAHAVCRR